MSILSLGLKTVQRIELKGQDKKEYKKELFIITMMFNKSTNIDNSIVDE